LIFHKKEQQDSNLLLSPLSLNSELRQCPLSIAKVKELRDGLRANTDDAKRKLPPPGAWTAVYKQ
jgi:hypothetical protein